MLDLIQAPPRTSPLRRPGLPLRTAAPGRPRRRTRAVALAAGVLVAALVAALRTHGVLGGAAAVVLALVLALAVPTSRHLPRRVLLLTGITAGVVPALWWWHLPVGDLGRAGLLLALLAGGLAAAVLWDGPARSLDRARAALPRPHAVDLVVAAATLAAAWTASAFLRISSAPAALAALLPAWDSSAHLDMVLMLRRHGSVVGALGPAAGGEHWKFAEYPQGFHALAATAVELARGPRPGAVEDELLAYAHAQGWLMVALGAVLACAVCALPAARRRPARALVVAAFVVGAFVVGPGATALREGFPNFAVAAALSACAVLLAASAPRRPSPLVLVALAGLVVGVAQTWVLLLAVAVPAVAVAVLPVRPRTWLRDRRTTVTAVLAVVAVLVGLAQTARVLLTLSPGAVLVIPGAITTTDPGVLLLVLAAAVALTAWPRGHGRTSTAWTLVVPAVAVLAVAGVGAVQLRSGGGLSYYFWKLLTGVTLTCTAVVAVAVLRWPGDARPSTWPARVRLAGVVAVASLGVTQLFGFTGLGRGALPASVEAQPQAAAVLQAATVAQGAAGHTRVTYLATDGVHPIQAQQWTLALTDRWTVEANDATAALVVPGGATRPLLETATALLADPHAVVVVSPQDRATLVGDPALAGAADRVLTW